MRNQEQKHYTINPQSLSEAKTAQLNTLRSTSMQKNSDEFDQTVTEDMDRFLDQRTGREKFHKIERIENIQPDEASSNVWTVYRGYTDNNATLSAVGKRKWEINDGEQSRSKRFQRTKKRHDIGDIIQTLKNIEGLKENELRREIVKLRKTLDDGLDVGVEVDVDADVDVDVELDVGRDDDTAATVGGILPYKDEVETQGGEGVGDVHQAPAAVGNIHRTEVQPIKYTKNTRPLPEELIQLDELCFETKLCGKKRERGAASQQLSRSVRKIVGAVLNKLNTPQQQVLALREATKHPKLRALCVSAGIVDVAERDVTKFIVSNVKEVLRLATRTKTMFGRPNDDRRSLVQCILLATLPSPNTNAAHKNKTQTPPSDRQLAQALGLPNSTYNRIIRSVISKRVSLELDQEEDNTTIYSQVVERGWKKINRIQREEEAHTATPTPFASSETMAGVMAAKGVESVASVRVPVQRFPVAAKVNGDDDFIDMVHLTAKVVESVASVRVPVQRLPVAAKVNGDDDLIDMVHLTAKVVESVASVQVPVQRLPVAAKVNGDDDLIDIVHL